MIWLVGLQRKAQMMKMKTGWILSFESILSILPNYVYFIILPTNTKNKKKTLKIYNNTLKN